MKCPEEPVILLFSKNFWFHLPSTAHFVPFTPIHTHRQTHIRTHLDISIPTHPATDTHMPRQTQACACTHIYIHTLTWRHTSAHIQNSMQKYTTHTYNHTHSPILLATHTHTLTHMPTKIFTYTYTKLHSYTKPHSYFSSNH